MKPAWTKGRTLPGGDLPAGGLPAWTTELARRYPGLPPAVVAGVAQRHGSLAVDVLGAAKAAADLGERFGAELTEAEVRYMVRHEWARTADDVLWRRSKCGLGLDAATRARVAACVAVA
jgi:glycerol-3-phosphate dehydrogenase